MTAIEDHIETTPAADWRRVAADALECGPADLARLAADRGEGPVVDAGTGLWQLFEAMAQWVPDRVAVRDGNPSRELTYRQLRHAAQAQSAALAAAGVGEGDCVALTVGRSARELVAILGVLRLGAAYPAIESDVPDDVVAAMFDAAGVRVVLGEGERLAVLGRQADRPTLAIGDPWESASGHGPLPPAAEVDPSRIAYVGFTSGSTGAPKGTRVPHRGVVRLARDPQFLRPGASDRFVRLAPLAFDASTLEIFAPLLAGGAVEVYPEPYLTPDGLGDFLRSRRITGLWLTAGLFRLVADYHPGAFRGVSQVLTGGDVVPPAQVIRVLRERPGLRVTNGYGPTENTTFTTVRHLDDVADVEDPLPIGRPIQGTGVVVLDPVGRLVPPGGVGELYTDGSGLALGYAARPEVLGSDRFGADDRFFDVGGDSLQLLRVAASLRRDLPGHDITIQDLYTCQTIRALSGRLHTRRRP